MPIKIKDNYIKIISSTLKFNKEMIENDERDNNIL